MAMPKSVSLAAVAIAALTLTAGIAAAKEPVLWNLTVNRIDSLKISPPGKNAWSAEQTLNDKDHSVDPDERLKITGIADGVYDVKFVDAKKRTCIVPNVALAANKITSIDEKELKGCTP